MGHGGDVKTVDWHGRKSLIASGSKDGLIKVGAKDEGHCFVVATTTTWCTALDVHHLLHPPCSHQMWDPRAGSELATWHAHKAMVTQVQWNQNGNWLLSVSRDALAKVWDMRMQREVGIFKGHARDVVSCDWHPLHEEVFATSAQDGAVAFWMASRPNPQVRLTPRPTTRHTHTRLCRRSCPWHTTAWHGRLRGTQPGTC